MIPASVLPELHVSSYEAIEMDLAESQAATYQRQARAVVAASVAVARRCVTERKNALFEGVHLLPGSLTAALERCRRNPSSSRSCWCWHDRDLHNRRLLHRQVMESGRDGGRHLARFEVIRNLQDTMRSMATRAGIREFDIGSEKRPDPTHRQGNCRSGLRMTAGRQQAARAGWPGRGVRCADQAISGYLRQMTTRCHSTDIEARWESGLRERAWRGQIDDANLWNASGRSVCRRRRTRLTP